jgi:hypothetical protein
MRRLADAPETNVGIFAFLLNLPWEFAQVPLFAGMAAAGHWTAIQVCGRATLGDVAISLVAFWVVAGTARSRIWILAPTLRRISGFVAVGILITIVMEWLATRVLGRWAYAPAMSVLPILEVGLADPAVDPLAAARGVVCAASADVMALDLRRATGRPPPSSGDSTPSPSRSRPRVVLPGPKLASPDADSQEGDDRIVVCAPPAGGGQGGWP